MQYKLQKIKSDASFREFFRLFKGKKTSIIVTASKEKFKNLTAYTAVNKFLRRNGIHTPKLISQHFNEGIIEIEDFGYKTLLDDVKKSLRRRTNLDKKRKNSPLIKVKDAILIRTDKLNKKQVLSKMSEHIEKLN